MTNCHHLFHLTILTVSNKESHSCCDHIICFIVTKTTANIMDNDNLTKDIGTICHPDVLPKGVICKYECPFYEECHYPKLQKLVYFGAIYTRVPVSPSSKRVGVIAPLN